MILTQLRDMLIEGLSALSGVHTVLHQPRRRSHLRLPAIIVDLVEIEAGTDSGSGELSLVAHWEARVVTAEKHDDTLAWQIVTAVMHWLFDFSWPMINCGRPMLKQAAPDHFMPDFQGHTIWLVEWTQTFRVGERFYNDDAGTLPEAIVVRWNEDCEETVLP